MSDPFIGQICVFGFNFAPRNWATCDGQIMSIATNTALFSLLGTTYGGNGQTTFALPDLRGRTSIHQGQGPGLSAYSLGQVAGTENTTLTLNNLATHAHTFAPPCVDDDATSGIPTARSLANSSSNIYANPTGTATMAPGNTGGAGSGQPFGIQPPYLVVNWCIAIQGIFPSRN
jgi:microcystin-dependent protein